MMKSTDLLTASGVFLTDQYQLTMAQLYYRLGIHETTAQFDHFFRSNPDYGIHKAGFCIYAGLDSLLDWLDESVFGETEINYLRHQKSAAGDPLFKEDFLDWLQHDFSAKAVNLYAMQEGRVVHPQCTHPCGRRPISGRSDYRDRIA